MNHRRRTLCIALALVAALSASASAGEDARVSIDLTAASLPDALKQLQQSSGLRLVFSDDLVKAAEPVTLKAENDLADDVLCSVLRPRGARR